MLNERSHLVLLFQNCKMCLNRILLFILCLCTVYGVQAKITLPSVFGPHMVLQQASTVSIWGHSDKGKKVTIETSWNHQKHTTYCGADGKWICHFQTPKGSHSPFAITISDGDPLLIEDVLIGEVWLCSGQSNMEMPVQGFKGQPVIESLSTIVNAKPDRPIRLFTVARDYSMTPKNTLGGNWQLNTPDAVRNFSATAYFFADQLQSVLDVPVGLVCAAWSGSKIEPWMDKAALDSFPEIDWSVLDREIKHPAQTPTLLFNAMIHPLKNYVFKGVVWYQGESNSANPDQYFKLSNAWIKQWRQFFNNNELPFYFVQIAPYQSYDKDDVNLALFRECQLNIMRSNDHVGMVVTTDVGDEKFIHAPNKKTVGQRLAYWALAKSYAIQGIPYCGPIAQSGIWKNKSVELLFSYAENGLSPELVALTGFELVDRDGNVVPAQAEIIRGTSKVKVWHDSISEPIEVRYCFKNYVKGSLFSTEGLPASSFRLPVLKAD